MTGNLRRTAVVAAVAVVLGVLLLSHRFGRADPTGDYRPELPPDALANGCYPLPGGATLDFGHQVRVDGDEEVDGEMRRVLVGQYDEIGERQALDAIVADFVEAGFVEADRRAPYDAVLRKRGPDGTDVVRALVEPLTGVEEDSLVRGMFRLDLPVVELPPDPPAVCSNQESTKRFVPWWLPT